MSKSLADRVGEVTKDTNKSDSLELYRELRRQLSNAYDEQDKWIDEINELYRLLRQLKANRNN